MLIKSVLTGSAFVLATCIANSAMADDHGGAHKMSDTKKMIPIYECTHNESTRRIEVLYPNSPDMLPCEVQYTKESGEIKTPYSAQNTSGYCEEKATTLMKKLEGWGWSCSGG